jgi:hypothetical protein
MLILGVEIPAVSTAGLDADLFATSPKKTNADLPALAAPSNNHLNANISC